MGYGCKRGGRAFLKFWRCGPGLLRRALCPCSAALLFAAPAAAAAETAPPLIAPVLKLNLAAQNITAPAVALSFDLCMGQTDRRIFDTLLRENIPATLFVSRRWLKNRANAPIIAAVKARPDLFEIANHGADHLPPIDNRPSIYGLKTAGSLSAVCAEAAGGREAIMQAGLGGQMSGKNWYRGAAALYSPNALRLLRRAGFSIAGFSLNGDEGATLSADKTYARILTAQNGDVVIAHMNRPQNAAGAGAARAIAALKARGYHFFRLSEAQETETAKYRAARTAAANADFLQGEAEAAAPNCPAALARMQAEQKAKALALPRERD